MLAILIKLSIRTMSALCKGNYRYTDLNTPVIYCPNQRPILRAPSFVFAKCIWLDEYIYDTVSQNENSGIQRISKCRKRF